MISAASYQIIYLTGVTLLILFLSLKYSPYVENKQTLKHHHPNTAGYIIAIILTLFIGFRPISSVFGDTVNYNVHYYYLHYGKSFDFSWDEENFLFDNLFHWLGANYYEITVFFLIIAAIYFLGSFKAITRLFPGNSLYAFIIYLSAFSTFTYATNGIKAGAAAALFLCAIAYRDRKWIAALLLFASLGFHHSMVVPIVAFIGALICKKPKYYYAFWIFCFLIAAGNITYFQELFAGLSKDESAVNYLTNTSTDWGGKTGFRWDFVVYSIFPLLVGWYTVFKRKVKSSQYNFILDIYLFANAIWMLCMYVPFNNRIAYLSWCLYPIVLVYPFFNCRQMMHEKRMLNSVVWIQLIFTLGMYFIYNA